MNQPPVNPCAFAAHGRAGRALALVMAALLFSLAPLLSADLVMAAGDGPAYAKASDADAPDPELAPECRTAPHPKWTEAEKWVWSRVCRGLKADFNHRYGRTLDPAKAEDWTPAERARRSLRPEFIQAIVFRKPWKEAIGRLGVLVYGALFERQVALHHGTLSWPFVMENCRLEDGMQASGLITSHLMSLSGCWADKPIALIGAKLGLVLSMEKSRFAMVNLTAAEVAGNLELNQAVISRQLELSGMRVDKFLFMRDGAFANARLIFTRVGLHADVSGSIFTGPTTMDQIQVQGNLYMVKSRFDSLQMLTAVIGNSLLANQAEVKDFLAMDGTKVNQLQSMWGLKAKNIRLIGMQIDGELAMNQCAVTGALLLDGIFVKRLLQISQADLGVVRMAGARIGQDLNLHQTKARQTVWMTNIKVGQNLTLSQGSFQMLSLSQAQIEQTLDIRGADFQLLDLRGASANTVWDGRQCKPDGDCGPPWSKSQLLDGFRYQRLGGTLAGLGTPLANRPSDWYVALLAQQKQFSPLPYEQIADLLRAAGQTETADDVRYAGMERERAEAWGSSWSRWSWLTTIKWLIGYGLGYRQFVALMWLVVLVAIGAVVLRFEDRARSRGLMWCIALSFERLIPIEYFSQEFEEFSMKSWPRYYFVFFHQPMGYVLAIFVVAAATGMVG